MYRYAIALGSNRRHGRHGAPARVLLAAMEAVGRAVDGPVVASPIIATRAVGPAGRSFSNGVLIATTELYPPELLAVLKEIERSFGRRRGRRWGARVLDLDILLWSGGAWRAAGLTIPHPRLAQRRFVLDPLATIAPEWRLPGGATVRQLRARLTRPAPVHRSRDRSGP